jgi:hypothetical protein
MVYARKISEDGWFGKEELDADSISELGTSGHQLSVWSVDNKNDQGELDKVALALALTRSKIEEFYIVFFDPTSLSQKYNWKVSFIEEDGDTLYYKLKKKHINFIIDSFWKMGYLAEYIYNLLKINDNYTYYDANRLTMLLYDAVENHEIDPEDIKKTQWGKALKKMRNEKEE